MLERAAHRLLVSPWFAAGAGFVIATGAIIYMPHATLNPAVTITRCKLASCKQKQLTPQVGAKPLPAGTGAPILVPGNSSVIAGMSFRYQVQERSAQYGFSMLITIHSPRRLDRWNLAFVINGARDVYVTYGALWRQSGTDGGTASSYASTESAGYAQISAHESGGAVEASRTGYTVTFQVRGNGTPGPPTDCFYDGVRCHFRQAPDPSSWSSWSSSG